MARPKETWINVNRHVIQKNGKHKTNDPPLRVTRGKHGKPMYGHRLHILDREGNTVASILYSRDEPLLPCGAKVAIVTDHEVVVEGDIQVEA